MKRTNMTSIISDVESALTKSRVLQDFWMTGGWDCWEKEMKKKSEEILDIWSLVDQAEPEIKIRIRITQHNFIYCVPLEDVTGVVDINRVLHIEEKDLYLDWKEKIISKVEESNVVDKTQVIDHKLVAWEKTEYLDKKGDSRIISERV